ncbi:hypothetical protein P6U16_04950 [Rhizobium sp. 32-5/1]|uniref:hypothetical protein n=1 Tax=Rhizobium sp. 32-5/1 TaxID=3019602 RepID=UPI00240DE51B|nr:hypothetical protein [Rhizobium sp. 32-5/1]WEZ84066.1 hypothetical protein P6U16_04950 [Rhizobium sp. 32-5/1]
MEIAAWGNANKFAKPETMTRNFGSMITRRTFVASLCSLPLVGCQDGGATVRFRVIAKVLYKGSKHEASTVMECRYARLKNSLVGMGGSTTLYGEALIFDLPGGGTFYVLPTSLNNNGRFWQIYEPGLLTTLGIKNSVGGLKDADLQRLAEASGRMPFNWHGRRPAMVSFRDEQVPKTIFEVTTSNMSQNFAGVTFAGLDIEFAKAPVTELLRERLPWLKLPSRTALFERDPPGAVRPSWDKPLEYKITQSSFFGNGSR